MSKKRTERDPRSEPESIRPSRVEPEDKIVVREDRVFERRGGEPVAVRTSGVVTARTPSLRPSKPPQATPRHTIPMGSGPPASLNAVPGALSSGAFSMVGGEAEVALRKQLSRLQRQLAEMSQALADRDDELALELGRRLRVHAQYEQAHTEARELRQQVAELEDAASRVAMVETRMAEALANTEEIAHSLERERRARQARDEDVARLATEYERAKEALEQERNSVVERLAAERQLADESSKLTLRQIEEAHLAALERQREAHGQELRELRASHAREVEVLRNEVEPQLQEARGAAAEREVLTAKLEAQRREAERARTEWEEQQAQLVRQLKQAHEDELASRDRQAQANLSAEIEKREAQKRGLKEACMALEKREASLTQNLDSMRATQKELTLETAQLKERVAQLEAERDSLQAQLKLAHEDREAEATMARTLAEHLEESEQVLARLRSDRERFLAYLADGLAQFERARVSLAPPAADMQASPAADMQASPAAPSSDPPDVTQDAELIEPPDLATDALAMVERRSDPGSEES